MRGYAQHDPVVEYRKEGFAMFDAMTAAIREDAVRLMMRARFRADQGIQREAVARDISERHSSVNTFEANGQVAAAASQCAAACEATGEGTGQARWPEGRPQRALPLRQRQEVQKLLRQE